jgi:hypothetical protein
MGLFITILLAGFAMLAAVALAGRVYHDDGARWQAAAVVWIALLVLPVSALGWGEALTASALGAFVAGASSVVLLAGAWGRWAETRDAVVSFFVAPGRLLARAATERSVATLGGVLVVCILAASAWVTYLAPSTSWDGLVYHEPIVAYAIQNAGFEMVPIPGDPLLQPINSFPRLAESLSVFFVIFADRRLIEIVPTLGGLLLVAAMFQIVRRVSTRVESLGWACALFLLPGFVLQLPTTYVDVFFAGICVAHVGYATTPTLRPPDVVFALLLGGMLLATKFTALAVSPVFAGIVILRVLWRLIRRPAAEDPHAPRRWSWVLALLLGVAAFVAVAAPTYVRNVEQYDNPVWPATLELGPIDWRGPYVSQFQVSEERLTEMVFGPPHLGRQYVDTPDNGYGNMLPFLVFPLLAIGLALLTWRVARHVRSREALHARDRSLWLAAVPLIAVFYLSPAFHWARYNLHSVAGAYLVMAWLGSRPRNRLLNEGLLGALILSAVATLWWSEPGWGVTRDDVLELGRVSAIERASFAREGTTAMRTELALAREHEITDGDVVAWTHVMFLGHLWNERFSNEVHHVPFMRGCEAYLETLEHLEAEWVSVQPSSSAARCLSDSGFEDLGSELPEGFVTSRPAHVYRAPR